MVDVQGLYGALQTTCAALQGPNPRQAEQGLHDLGQTPYPYLPQLVQLAWEQSNDTLVLFHAGHLLKKGIVRDWRALEGPARLQLHRFVLQFLTDRHLSIEKAAWGQGVQCLCVLHKLWWQSNSSQDPEGVKSNVEAIQQTVGQFYGGAQAETKRVGVELAANLVLEFSHTATKGTDLGLTWEAHEQCRLGFQEQLLFSILHQTVTLLSTCHQQRVLQCDPQAGARLIGSGLTLMSYALAWNFDPMSADRAMNYLQEDSTLLTPPGGWAGALLSDDFVSFLVALQTDVAAISPEASATFYPVYIQLASLTGKIFGSDRDVVKQQKHQHFERMMKLIFAVLRRAAAVPSDGPEAGPGLIGGCQAYARLVSTIDPAVGFFAAEHYEASCAETHRLTLHVMQQLAQDPANHCLVEALDAMLEVWVTLITDKVCQVYAHQFHRATNACVDERRVQCLLKSSADLVQQFVQFKLTCHSLGDDELDPDHEKEYHVSQLRNVAQLGKQNPSPNLHLLTQKLMDAVTQYASFEVCPPANPQALEQVQDAVLFVLQFSIEVLTDPDDSEAALIPDPIITMGKRHERRSDAEHSNECCQLVRSTLSYAECEDKYLEHAPHLVSPLVCAQQLTFLTRYVRSYLMPDVDEYGDFCTTYATSFQEGHELVELCLGKVLHCLRFMASEASVLTQAIALLRAIVVKRRIQTVLAASPKWRVFVEAVDHNDFGRLPSDCRRELFEVLCIGFGADHLHVLCRPLQQQFEGLMQQPGFVEKCQTEAVRQGVECCLEKLRGVSRAGLSGRAQAQRVFQFVTQTQILPTVVRLMDLYYTRHDVLILIIRCFDDLVVSQNMFSSDEETCVLCEKCLELVQAYASRNASSKMKNPMMSDAGLISSPSKPGSLASAEDDEELDILQALLDLLVHMTEWDMLDFSGEIGRRKFDIGGVSFMGLSAVLRMVTPAVLEVPELSQKLFSLLLHLVQAYPDHLSRLDPQLFGMILQAISYALDSTCVEVSKCGFKAVAAIARYHHGTRCTSPLPADFLHQMCSKVLRLCVDCYFDSSLLTSVGAACWALFCVLQDQAQALMQTCIAEHPQAPQMLAAFQQLVTANGVDFSGNTRQHKSAFSDNFEIFVATMRALRMK